MLIPILFNSCFRQTFPIFPSPWIRCHFRIDTVHVAPCRKDIRIEDRITTRCRINDTTSQCLHHGIHLVHRRGKQLFPIKQCRSQFRSYFHRIFRQVLQQGFQLGLCFRQIMVCDIFEILQLFRRDYAFVPVPFGILISQRIGSHRHSGDPQLFRGIGFTHRVISTDSFLVGNLLGKGIQLFQLLPRIRFVRNRIQSQITGKSQPHRLLLHL